METFNYRQNAFVSVKSMCNITSSKRNKSTFHLKFQWTVDINILVLNIGAIRYLKTIIISVCITYLILFYATTLSTI